MEMKPQVFEGGNLLNRIASYEPSARMCHIVTLTNLTKGFFLTTLA